MTYVSPIQMWAARIFLIALWWAFWTVLARLIGHGWFASLAVPPVIMVAITSASYVLARIILIARGG